MSGPASMSLDEAFLRDPFPKFAELRASDPIHWDDTFECFTVSR
jgi:hypothetical protein